MNRFTAVLGLVAVAVALQSPAWGQGPIPAGTVNLRTLPKGATAAGTLTSTSVSADIQALDVFIQGGGAGVSQGIPAIGQSGPMIQGIVVGVPPLFTPGTIQAVTLTPLGAVRVDTSGSKISVTGNTGAALDAAGQNAPSPTNELLVGGQFNTTPTTLTSGNVSPLQLDSTGNLRTTVNAALPTGSNTIGAVTQGGTWTVQPGNTANTTAWLVTGTGGTFPVTCANCSGTITADVSDRAARLVGQVEGRAASGVAKAGNPSQIGGVFNTTQPTVTTGQVVEAQATARGALIVGTGVDTFNTTINAALPTGANTIGAVTQASGPWTSNVTQFGGTNLSTGTGAGGFGIPRVTISNDSSLAPNQSVNVNQVGGTATFLDHCRRGAKTYVRITQTAGTQLATGVAAQRIYICSFQVVSATAQNIALVSGTGVVCATGITGAEGFGGATAATGWNLAANGGLTYGNGGASLGRTSADADNLCLLQSGTGQVSGGLSYVSF